MPQMIMCDVLPGLKADTCLPASLTGSYAECSRIAWSAEWHTNVVWPLDDSLSWYRYIMAEPGSLLFRIVRYKDLSVSDGKHSGLFHQIICNAVDWIPQYNSTGISCFQH